MILLDAQQLPDYLRTRRLLGPGESCRIEALSGGVSNVVLRVEPKSRPAFVVKQSRERLQTQTPWFSRLDRIFRETAMMKAVRPLLPKGAIPRILDEDRENYAYAMEAVDANHIVWKRELLAGRVREEVALRLADYLAAIHGCTQGDPSIAQEFDDREVFVQLRVDPFYRHVARVHADLSGAIGDLIDEMWQSRLCLVHADFSPKNVLIVDEPSSESARPGAATSHFQVTLVDFETGHYGDPAFDLGFFLSHLLLKAVRAGAESPRYVGLAQAFWDRYRQRIAESAPELAREAANIERRAAAHLAACALARVDGTSPVDYLPEAGDRDLVRAFGRGVFRHSAGKLVDAMGLRRLLAACQFLPEVARSFNSSPNRRRPIEIPMPQTEQTRIESVRAREVFDSRGKPTVEVEIRCRGSRLPGRAIVPSGASTGTLEAKEVRDGDPNRVDGDGVLRAVENVNGPIATALLGRDADDQAAIDEVLCKLDGTPDKSRLGANAVLGASLASAHAAASAKGVMLVEHLHEIWRRLPPTAGMRGTGPANQPGRMVLPLPMVNMISGGLHAGGNLDFQDFLIIATGARSLRQALDWTVTIYRRLGEVLREGDHEGVLVGDEGGYGPKLASNVEAVHCLLRAIERAGLRPGEDVHVALDVASSHFCSGGRYRVADAATGPLRSAEMIALLESWVDRFPIVSIEDGLAEDDWPGWKRLTERLGNRVQLIGDDLFVTQTKLIEQGVASGVANSVLIKLNQVGTLSETLAAIRTTLDAGYRPVISARSGETEDTTIADLAVATGAGQIKIGSVARSERLAKYNQLLRLEEKLGDRAIWPGKAIFAGLGR
jgi:enolase